MWLSTFLGLRATQRPKPPPPPSPAPTIADGESPPPSPPSLACLPSVYGSQPTLPYTLVFPTLHTFLSEPTPSVAHLAPLQTATRSSQPTPPIRYFPPSPPQSLSTPHPSPSQPPPAPFSAIFYEIQPRGVEPASGHATQDAALAAATPTAHSAPATHSPSVHTDFDFQFPHTAKLLWMVLRGALEDPKLYVVSKWTAVLVRVCETMQMSPINRDQYRLAIRNPNVVQYLSQGLIICISSVLEQPYSERVAWGQTNVKAEHKDKLGLYIPALNWALCKTYEHCFSGESSELLRRRGQLGSLIAIALIHEITHSLIRWRLDEFVDLAEFSIPEVGGDGQGEAGWELENLLFQGVIQACWDRADVLKASRFDLIRDVWKEIPNSKLRKLPIDNLVTFHNRILQGSLTMPTMLDLDISSEPLVSRATVIAGDRCLLRESPRPKPKRRTRYPVSYCGLGLSRFPDYPTFFVPPDLEEMHILG
ncbi:hypothetical protein GGX14DRAFT_622223 [Mycena pura]|uniref:Uncharacterized protein n=1 Tax=Mycena pura TaxID=153505 RepID=A0AAD6YGE1_9AGAR|nr:hypothetical protein GGX14DRAFT_622223 [Mycena pura]